MPDTVEESSYNGKPVLKILYGFFKDEPQYVILGLKKLKAIDENIDRIRMFIDKYEKGKK
jgi:hypothetical protein